MASGHSAQNSPNDQGEGERVAWQAILLLWWRCGAAIWHFLCTFVRETLGECVCVSGCGLLLCRLGQVAWFTFSSRWRQILYMCVCVSAHKSPHFLEAVFPFHSGSLYVRYVSFWISLPFRKVCLYADMYAKHTQTHLRTCTHVFMKQIRPHVRCHVLCQRVCISTICAVLLPPPLNILYVPECC